MKQKAPQLSEAFIERQMVFTLVSGWRDSNSRPPAPKAGALPLYLLIYWHIVIGQLNCVPHFRVPFSKF